MMGEKNTEGTATHGTGKRHPLADGVAESVALGARVAIPQGELGELVGHLLETWTMRQEVTFTLNIFIVKTSLTARRALFLET